MAVIPAKKRGRPRKSVVAEVPYDSLASPVSENSGSKRPRRNASKKAVANFAQLVHAGRDDVIILHKSIMLMTPTMMILY